MKYFIIFTIMSIAGTAGVIFETQEIPVEHLNFDPIYINVEV